MFKSLFKFLGFSGNDQDSVYKHLQLTGSLDDDIENLMCRISPSKDLIMRELKTGQSGHYRLALVYLQSLNKPTVISEVVLKPLLKMNVDSQLSGEGLLQVIKQRVVSVGNLTKTSDLSLMADAILEGDSVLLIEGSHNALLLGTNSPEVRAVSETENEVGVRGPKEGFTETLRINLSQIRRRLRDPKLTFEAFRLGTRTKTEVALAYIDGLADESLVQEVTRRLTRINTSAVLESGYIEQLIEDSHWSLFSTIANSERPDAVTSKLLEGKVAILVDGSPTVLTAPMSFVESFQHPEDYYSRPFYVSMVRLIRFISFFTALLAPALYVALVSYHQAIIPTALLVTVAAAAEGTPFPAWLEIIVMTVIFEVLREAALRMPRAIGQAVSIVGALVLGQAAIQAGIVGAPVVIVIAVTALATFVVPPQTDSSTMLRVILVGAAAMAGLFGVLIVMLFILVHLCSLRSLGVPYLEPLAPLRPPGLTDVLLRYPLVYLKDGRDNEQAD